MTTESTINEYGYGPGASTILAPLSTGTGIDTPATSASSSATAGPLHERYTGMQGHRTVIPPPISLSAPAPIPEGKFAVKQQNITNKATQSKPRRVRRGGFCPLDCGTKLSRVDHYRVESHWISCPKYTGDREALKARYRKKRKPITEKEAAQASNQANLKALSDQTIAATINWAETATVALTHPLSQDIDLNRRALYPAVQATPVAETSLLPAMALSSPPTPDFLYSLTPDGNGNTMYSTNDMNMLQFCSYPHHDVFAIDTIPTQPYWDPSDAAQVHILSDAVADRRPSEPLNSTYTQEFTDELQTPTIAEADLFAALGLSSKPTLVFHYPSTPYSGNGDATYPINNMSMLQPGLYPHRGKQFAMSDTIPTQPHRDPLDITQVPAPTNTAAVRRFVEPVSPAYAQEFNLYPAMRLSSHPTINMMPRNGNGGDTYHPTNINGMAMLQPGLYTYTNTQNSDWHFPSTTSGWEQ